MKTKITIIAHPNTLITTHPLPTISTSFREVQKSVNSEHPISRPKRCKTFFFTQHLRRVKNPSLRLHQFQAIFLFSQKDYRHDMLPSVTTTPQAIHTIRAIPTDPAPSSTPLGEMKIPDPAKTTLHYIIIMYTGNRSKQRTMTLSPTTIFAIHVYNGVQVFKCQSYTKYEMRKRDLHYSMSLMQLVCCFANQYSDILEFSMQEKKIT